MTHPSVLFVSQGKKCFIYHNIKWRPTFLELATTLKYLGASGYWKKKKILCPDFYTSVAQERKILITKEFFLDFHTRTTRRFDQATLQ